MREPGNARLRCVRASSPGLLIAAISGEWLEVRFEPAEERGPNFGRWSVYAVEGQIEDDPSRWANNNQRARSALRTRQPPNVDRPTHARDLLRPRVTRRRLEDDMPRVMPCYRVRAWMRCFRLRCASASCSPPSRRWCCSGRRGCTGFRARRWSDTGSRSTSRGPGTIHTRTWRCSKASRTHCMLPRHLAWLPPVSVKIDAA